MAERTKETGAGARRSASAATDGAGEEAASPEGADEQTEPRSAETLAEALLAAQQEYPALLRDAENKHFDSKYVTISGLLSAVLPVLNAHGLLLVQYPTAIDGQPALQTVIWHAPSNEHIQTVMLLLASKSDPQGQGSALTYARRYSIEAMLGLAASDDDGNAATDSRRRESQAQDETSRAEKMRGRIFKLCEALDAQTKQEAGSWRGGVEEAAQRDFGVPFQSLQAGELEEVGKYLKAQQEAGITEVPAQIDFSVPF